MGARAPGNREDGVLSWPNVLAEPPSFFKRASIDQQVAASGVQRTPLAVGYPLGEVEQVGSGPDRVARGAISHRSGDRDGAITSALPEACQPSRIRHRVRVQEGKLRTAGGLRAYVARFTGKHASRQGDQPQPRRLAFGVDQLLTGRAIDDERLRAGSDLRLERREDPREGGLSAVGGHDHRDLRRTSHADSVARLATKVMRARPGRQCNSMYRLVFNILRHLEAERAHELAKWGLRVLCATAPGRGLVRWLAGAPDEGLTMRALGLTFPSPIGVAAGLDKEASWHQDLAALGFGFVEVGTITADAQGGNPRPRVARLLRERALVNRMGSPNPGAGVVAARLEKAKRQVERSSFGSRRRSPGVIVGVNVGRTARAGADSVGEDYRAAACQLAPVADYIAINISSPNTPGLRDLQAIEVLRALIAEVRAGLRESGSDVPLLVKIAPDLDDDQLDAIAAAALELELDGIIAVNTTTSRLGLDDRGVPFKHGGVSGAPLRRRSLEVLRRLRATVGQRLILVSVGGVEGGDDVWQRILAGASLVQVYTGFVYGGPGWPRRVNRLLARRLRESGHSSIQKLVGAGEGPGAPKGLPDVGGPPPASHTPAEAGS